MRTVTGIKALEKKIKRKFSVDMKCVLKNEVNSKNHSDKTAVAEKVDDYVMQFCLNCDVCA